MSDTLEEHDGMVSIGDRNTSLRFADDIDVLGRKSRNQEVPKQLHTV